MSMKVVIVDYGMGNLLSINKKISHLNVDLKISSNPKEIIKADKLILPGVGHFNKAMDNILNLGLYDTINELVLIKQKPILGICLGMQLMAKHSEEGNVDGLGWFDAEVVKFKMENIKKYKVPNIGWNQIIKTKESALMKDVPKEAEFYFIHSYYLKTNKESDILNETYYERKFVSAIEKQNIFGVQYHPEKSFEAGETLIKNFIYL